MRVYDPTRKQKIHVGTRPTHREAKQLERDKEAEFARKQLLEHTTIADFAERWLVLYPRPSETTERRYTQALVKFVEDFGERRFDAVTRAEALYWSRHNTWRRQAVCALYNDAIDAGVARSNPFARPGLARTRGRADIKVLEPEELFELADKAVLLWKEYGEHYRAMVIFAACVCLRPSEMFGLDWDDVHFEKDEIRIHRQFRYDGSWGPPKNGRTRTVILPPPAREAILTMPRLATDQLFSTPRGRRFRNDSNHSYWSKLAAVGGYPGMDFYELRHFGATLLLEMGASDWDVAIQLGHTDGGKLVREVYGHPSHERARERMRQLWVANGWQAPDDSALERAAA